jgi:hypothetical protein
MQQSYSYKKADFDKDGKDKDGVLLSDMIPHWEAGFYDEFSPFCANYLLANYSTMHLLKRCFYAKETEDFGMDGDFDLDTNLKIEEHSLRQTIYALGSSLNGNEDEPLYLVTDENVPDETVIFKYAPIDDDENDDEIPDPVDPTGSRDIVDEETEIECVK